MKRDMDLVRKILMAIEESPKGFAPSTIKVEGYDDDQVGYHIMLMAQANLLVGRDLTTAGAKAPRWIAAYLTWDGHEFLDAARDEGNWSKATNAVNRAGGMAFDVLKGVLIKLLSQGAMDAL